MLINDSSKVIRIDDLQENIDYSSNTYLPVIYKDKYNQTKIIRSVIKVEDEFYHCKDIYSHDNWLINELIGSYLAKQLDLPSVDYQIGIYKGFKYALSKIFYEEDFLYYFPKYKSNEDLVKYGRNYDKNNLYKDKLRYLDKKVKIKMLKLIALDLKMGQYDRHEYNIMFKKKKSTGEVDLTDIYDYGLSYSAGDLHNYYYFNPFMKLSRNSYGINKLMRKHPEIVEYIDKMKSISMEKILDEITKEKEIEFSPKEKSIYTDLDNKNNKVLEKCKKGE